MPVLTNIILAAITSSITLTNTSSYDASLLANDEDTFKVWTTEPGSYINLVDNASSYTTNFTMPNADVEVIANSTKEDRMIIATYVPNPKVVVSDGNNYKLTVTKGKALIDGKIVTEFPVEVLGGTNVQI